MDWFPDLWYTFPAKWRRQPAFGEKEKMNTPYEIPDLHYQFGETEQHLFPTVLFGKNDIVLVDCGYPGSLFLLEEQLCAHAIEPGALTKLVLTHQDDDHIGAAAEWKERCPDLQILASCAEAPYPSGDRKNLRLQQGEALQPQLPEEQRAFGEQFCERYRNLNTISVALLLRDGDRFDWGDGCEIIATPGHTPGHISIRSLDNEYMITGDAAVLEGRQPAIANPEFCLDRKEAQHPLERIAHFQYRRYICYHGGVLDRQQPVPPGRNREPSFAGMPTKRTDFCAKERTLLEKP